MRIENLRSARLPVTAVVALTVALLSVGCVKSKTSTFAKYERGAEPLVRPAPEGGLYRVQWMAERDGEPESVVQSKRIIRRGDDLGFTTDPDGRVFAVAGPETFPLDKLPHGARYCAWSYKYERPTQFATNLRATADVAGKAAVIGVVGAGLIAGEIALQAFEGDDDCDEGDDRGGRHHHHGHKPKPGKGGAGKPSKGDPEPTPAKP